MNGVGHDLYAPMKRGAVFVRFGRGAVRTNVYLGIEGISEVGFSIDGWEHLCSMVDEWRERQTTEEPAVNEDRGDHMSRRDGSCSRTSGTPGSRA